MKGYFCPNHIHICEQGTCVGEYLKALLPIKYNMLRYTLLAVIMVVQVHQYEAVRRRTRYGWIRGFTTDNANVFLGVPYAQPPERTLRYVTFLSEYFV